MYKGYLFIYFLQGKKFIQMKNQRRAKVNFFLTKKNFGKKSWTRSSQKLSYIPMFTKMKKRRKNYFNLKENNT